MRAIIETVFDIFYLATVLTVGIRMIRSSQERLAIQAVRPYGCGAGCR